MTENNLLNYFDEVVLVEIVRRFCCFVNSSIDDAELLSSETESIGGSLILDVDVV